MYDDTVIIASFNDNGGEIDVRSAGDGHLLGSFPLAGTHLAAPVVLNGTIYIGTSDGIFHAIRMSTS